MKIVTLRVVKGKAPSFNSKGKMLNENQTVKLEHGTLSWKNYMNNLIRNGYCEVTVEAVNEVQYDDKKKEIRVDGLLKLKEVDAKAINAEVQEVMKPVVKAVSIEEELEDLKVQMLKLQKGDVKQVVEVEEEEVITESDKPEDSDEEPTEENNDVDELEFARESYLQVFGKKPHHAMRATGIQEKIEEELGN